MTQTWFITGCSTGFGRAIAQHAIAQGYNVVVSARRATQIEDLAALAPHRTLALTLDVTNDDQISEAVRAAEIRFGSIDVLVNNAGIGYFGAFEETDLDEARAMFEINVWGLAKMSRAVLPGMRKRRTGTIVNISSIGGLHAYPSLSFYAATKFAVEALSEGLSREASPLGIKVLLVEPSGFRTDWAGRSAAQARTVIADYAVTSGAFAATVRASSGNQAGDPVRAAAAIDQAVNAADPPLRLLLGKAALSTAREKIELLQRDFDAWERVTINADFPL